MSFTKDDAINAIKLVMMAHDSRMAAVMEQLSEAQEELERSEDKADDLQSKYLNLVPLNEGLQQQVEALKAKNNELAKKNENNNEGADSE